MGIDKDMGERGVDTTFLGQARAIEDRATEIAKEGSASLAILTHEEFDGLISKIPPEIRDRIAKTESLKDALAKGKSKDRNFARAVACSLVFDKGIYEKLIAHPRQKAVITTAASVIMAVQEASKEDNTAYRDFCFEVGPRLFKDKLPNNLFTGSLRLEPGDLSFVFDKFR